MGSTKTLFNFAYYRDFVALSYGTKLARFFSLLRSPEHGILHHHLLHARIHSRSI